MAKKIDLDGLEHFKQKENASIAGTESSSTASKAYKVGEYFYFKGTLVICTVDIASGGTITLNTNCKTVPLAQEVSDLKTAIDDNIFQTNILFEGDVTVSGTSTYVSKDILQLTSFSAGDSFSITADSVTGASSQTPFYCYVRNGTTNLNSSTNGTIAVTQANIDAGADNVLFRFYPAAGTALPTGTATAKNLTIRKTNEQPFVIQDNLKNGIRSQVVNDLLVVNNISTPEYISTLQQKVFGYVQPINLVGTWNEETFLNSDGSISENSSYATSAKFPVTQGLKIVFTRAATATTRMKERYGYAFYGEDETTVVSVNATFSDSAVTVPSGAYYALVCTYNAYMADTYQVMVEYTDGTNISATYQEYFTPYCNYKPTATNMNSTKKLCVFGDSLAASGNGGTDTWINRVGNALGFGTVYDRGVGSSMVTDGTTMYAYVDASGDAYNRGAYTEQQTIAGYTEIDACLSSTDRAETIPTDTNVLIILAGSNDVGQIGQAGESTFTAKYKTMLDNIYDRVPNALVYLCTFPFHYAFDTGESAEVYEEYREIIRTIGHEYGFPVIDLKRKMMVNANNYATYMNEDKVHYNTTNGRKKTAEAVIPYLFGYMYITE